MYELSSYLLHVGPSMSEKVVKVFQSSTVQHYLCLVVVARDNVPHRTQGGGLETMKQ